MKLLALHNGNLEEPKQPTELRHCTTASASNATVYAGATATAMPSAGHAHVPARTRAAAFAPCKRCALLEQALPDKLATPQRIRGRAQIVQPDSVRIPDTGTASPGTTAERASPKKAVSTDLFHKHNLLITAPTPGKHEDPFIWRRPPLCPCPRKVSHTASSLMNSHRHTTGPWNQKSFLSIHMGLPQCPHPHLP